MPGSQRSRDRRQRFEARTLDERVLDVEFRLREVVMLLRIVVVVAGGNLLGRVLEALM